jgi:uncharacterized protein (DUF302 family)
MTYTMSTTVARPYDETVEAVREALAEQGFGILTEIDIKATLKKKLDVDVAPQIILGACRPPLAYQALQADPSIGALLPCNVVVRAQDATTTLVEAVDPDAMMSFSDQREALTDVACDAKERLQKALAAVSG